jgi:hypothetical protein
MIFVQNTVGLSDFGMCSCSFFATLKERTKERALLSNSSAGQKRPDAVAWGYLNDMALPDAVTPLRYVASMRHHIFNIGK